MPIDRFAASRMARRATQRIAEPRRHTSASQNAAAMGMTDIGVSGDQYNIIIFGRSLWDTHKWGDGGKIVFDQSKWGRQVWG